MKKVVRLVISTVVLATLFVSQIPTAGNCQMMIGGVFAKSCSMPCCKTHPSQKCPFTKLSTPKDFIDDATQSVDLTLQPAHMIHQTLILPIQRILYATAEWMESVRSFITGTPILVRAPPSDIPLINA